MTVLLFALLASCATFVGGLLALRFRDQLHLILGFSAGAVAGVAFFDLLPESFELGMAYHTPGTLALAVALGFFGYLILDRLILLHAHDEHGGHEHSPRGVLGALTLSAHSFLDGVAIGVGFQAAPSVGLVVSAAVLAHDFSDGVNAVSMVLRSSASRKLSFGLLALNSLAPILGALATFMVPLGAPSVGLVLAVFVGSFLFLSASDLIPESHHRHPRALTTVMTLLGALLMYGVVSLVH